MIVRVIALGNEDASDDGAAMAAARRLRHEEVELLIAGRPGVGLLDLLDPAIATVLTDVVACAGAPGRIHELPLSALLDRGRAVASVSSHGFGPVEALRLGRALGRPLPLGTFVGIEGACFEPGRALSKEVERAIGGVTDALHAAVDALRT